MVGVPRRLFQLYLDLLRDAEGFRAHQEGEAQRGRDSKALEMKLVSWFLVLTTGCSFQHASVVCCLSEPVVRRFFHKLNAYLVKHEYSKHIVSSHGRKPTIRISRQGPQEHLKVHGAPPLLPGARGKHCRINHRLSAVASVQLQLTQVLLVCLQVFLHAARQRRHWPHGQQAQEEDRRGAAQHSCRRNISDRSSAGRYNGSGDQHQGAGGAGGSSGSGARDGDVQASNKDPRPEGPLRRGPAAESTPPPVRMDVGPERALACGLDAVEWAARVPSHHVSA